MTNILGIVEEMVVALTSVDVVVATLDVTSCSSSSSPPNTLAVNECLTYASNPDTDLCIT